MLTYFGVCILIPGHKSVKVKGKSVSAYLFLAAHLWHAASVVNKQYYLGHWILYMPDAHRQDHENCSLETAAQEMRRLILFHRSWKVGQLDGAAGSPGSSNTS